MNYLLLVSPRQAGAYVKEQRTLQGLTQKELESKCNFPSGYIGKLERGELRRIAVPDANELEFVLRKFKRKNFEARGKCVLQVSESTSDKVSNPKANKSKTSSSMPTLVGKSQADVSAYTLENLTIERVSSNQARPQTSYSSSATSVGRTTKPPVDNEEEELSISMIFEAIWRVAIFIGIVLVIGIWIFGGQDSVVDDFAPNPLPAYDQTPAQIPAPAQFDQQGFDAQGYDRSGYDRSGYDRFGYDRSGRDINGRDRSGYDRLGFDKLGFDRNGLDVFGYDAFGRDASGFDRSGRDAFGRDRSGCNTNTRQDAFGRPC